MPIELSPVGPPFTHQTLPIAAHYIGSTTPQSCPGRYLDSVQALMQSYHVKVDAQTRISSDDDDNRITEVVPLIVNTMGWTKGLGADLARRIEDMVEPTAVFETGSPVEEEGAPSHHRPGGSTRVEPAPLTPLTSRYTPADHRALSILSYLHAFPPTTTDGTLSAWDTSRPLRAHAPYEVDVRVAFDSITLVGPGAEDVVPSELWRVLNGALVALVEFHEDPQVGGGGEQGSLYVQGGTPPYPSSSRCIGLALVRGVSADGSRLHVLTPVPPRLLASCRVLVKGPLELPVWGMLDFEGALGGAEDGMPYLQWGRSEGIGAERRRTRWNLMRRGLT